VVRQFWQGAAGFGVDSLGGAWCGWAVMVRRGWLGSALFVGSGRGSGMAVGVWLGLSRWGLSRQSRLVVVVEAGQGAAGPGGVGRGWSRLVAAVAARKGPAWAGWSRQGVSRLGSRVPAWWSRCGKEVRLVSARRGAAWQLWLVRSRFGWVRHGSRRVAGHGWSRQGAVRCVMAVEVRQGPSWRGLSRRGSRGPARRGPVGLVEAWRGSQGGAGAGQVCHGKACHGSRGQVRFGGAR
jgi:hypothetical protein